MTEDIHVRRNPTGIESDLFQLIKIDANGNRNIYEIKQFFKRPLSSRLFDINCYNEHGLTPLMVAACNFNEIQHHFERTVQAELHQKEIIVLLLSHGADVNIQTNGRKLTALHYTCACRSYNIVKLLLSRGANPDLKNIDGMTPLMYASHRESFDFELTVQAELHQKDIILLLLSQGADVDIQTDGRKMTALHYACACRSNNIVKLLLSRGANPDLKDIDGMTPLMYSSHRADFDSMKAILECGVDMNIEEKDSKAVPIHMIFMSKFKNPICDVIRGVKLLMKYGANMNLQDAYGATILFFAINRCGRIDSEEELVLDLIKFLLDANADLNIQITKDVSCNCYWVGDTTLHIAVVHNKVKVVQLLLERHQNLSIRNSKCETALDRAKKLKFSAIIQLIEEEHRGQVYKYLMSHWASLPK